MWNNLRIGQRLAAGFGILLLLTMAAIGLGLYGMHSVEERNQRLLDEPLRKERITSDWYRVIESGSRRTMAMAVSADPVLEATFREDMKTSSALSTKYQKSLTELATSDAERRLMDDIAKARKVYLDLRNEIADARRDGKAAEATALVERLKPATTGYLAGLQALLDHQRASIDAQALALKNEVARGLWTLAGLGVLILFASAVIGFVITQGITRPLASFVKLARRIANGDVHLDVRVDRRDEMGDLQAAMAEMTGQLRGMIDTIRDGANVIAMASTEIASSNADLSRRTESQSASLQETASSLEQLSRAVHANAESSAEAQEVVHSATTSAREGDQVVQAVVGTMQAITASSKRISDIIGVIDGIAFQTNILALNAAVEAARAGEQGRGFAVVAGEVRTLAQRSAVAAKEIRSLILNSVDSVDAGARQVEQAGARMQVILSAVERVNTIIGEIAIASRQQAAGVEQVNRAVMTLDTTTQQNASMVEESAASAQTLQGQSARLVDSIAVFNSRD
ncbi:MAG: methyl-accepting chemotaxis protein [Rubrivivax sp.]|jgi:methyl-accepting chemotaxis protein